MSETYAHVDLRDGRPVFLAPFCIYIYIYIYITNIPPIMIINKIHENQNLLSLELVSFLVGLRTYQHPYIYFNSGPQFTGSSRALECSVHIDRSADNLATSLSLGLHSSAYSIGL